MDFVGQRHAEQQLVYTILVCAAAGFIIGYLRQEFQLMVLVNAAGLGLSAILAIPSWPWLKRHPVKWLPPLNPDCSTKK
ncbi:12 kDa subunit of signal peptidase [Haematococcus lacustris]